MNVFTCAAVAPGSLLPREVRAGLRAPGAPGNVAATLSGAGFAAAASTEPGALRPLLARHGALLAAGDARLDNRAEVAAWGGVRADGASDLALVAAAVAARGPACLGQVLGDFAVVLWDEASGTLTAARDAFGVKPLFMALCGGVLRLASRAAALGGEALDEEWAADFLAGAMVTPGRTVWAGVQAVPPGTTLTWRGGAPSLRRFWEAAAIEPAAAVDEREAAGTFRALFHEAVRVRTEGGVPVWSQLSGGLDSSSVVCVAQALAREGKGPGLAGTLTLADTLGDGDERRFSDAVASHAGVRNEAVVDPWAWQDDGMAPALADEPRPHFPFWARDRAMVALVRRAGGRVLLSGQGPDHYLSGNMGFVADQLAAGQVGAALGGLVRFAVASRQSFWTGLGRHGIDPFLPAALKARRARAGEPLPAWIDPGFARRMEMERRLPLARRLAAPRAGSRFAHQVALELDGLSAMLERGAFQDGIEMRYPFLHRPLVEHALRLPPSMRIRPGGGKHVLREAMRGILPEVVRARRRKGGIDARVLWALQRERPRLDALLRDPELARRGWVSAAGLRAAVERARQGEVDSLPFLLCTLALETWLAVRSGRWDALAGPHAAAA
ncbi:MAG TPA: asparagine synthase-related protein [Longimicrobium sp.]|nr:asparagine synthase-related protein [Longimicrobium sp.]